MKKMLLSFAVAFSLAFGVGNLMPVAYASSTDAAKNAVCSGVSGTTGDDCGSGGSSLNKVISAVLNIISVIAGLLAVIMIIISGIKYITSNGEAQAVTGAKRTLVYAIVGLIVVAASQFIVWFVLSNLQKT